MFRDSAKIRRYEALNRTPDDADEIATRERPHISQWKQMTESPTYKVGVVTLAYVT
jgi:hypothetical protein